jgi:hypothetical protein
VWKWVALLLLLLLLFLAGACERRRPGGGSQPAVEPRPTAGRENPRTGGTAVREDGAGTGPEAKVRGTKKAPSDGDVVPSREITLQKEPEAGSPAAPAGGGAQGPLVSLRGPAQLPEDFRIGPLTDLLAPGNNERKVLRVSTSFLEGLVAGKIVEEAVLPENRVEMRRSLQYYVDQGLVPQHFRFGSIYLNQETGGLGRRADSDAPGTSGTETADTAFGGAASAGKASAGTAWMNIRLFGSPGVAEGELYLTESEGKWYVSDIQVGFPFLGEAYERDTEKFIPSVYGWRLQ